MGNKAVKQHFETAEKTGVLKISNKRLKVSENNKNNIKICVIVIIFEFLYFRIFHHNCAQ